MQHEPQIAEAGGHLEGYTRSLAGTAKAMGIRVYNPSEGSSK